MEIGEGLKYVIGIDHASQGVFFLILLLLYCLLEFCHVIPEKRFKSVFCNRSDFFFSDKIQHSSVPCMTANNCTMDKSLRDNTLNIAKLYKISHVQDHVITTKTKDHKRHSSAPARQCRLLTYMLTGARAKFPRAW